MTVWNQASFKHRTYREPKPFVMRSDPVTTMPMEASRVQELMKQSQEYTCKCHGTHVCPTIAKQQADAHARRVTAAQPGTAFALNVPAPVPTPLSSAALLRSFDPGTKDLTPMQVMEAGRRFGREAQLVEAGRRFGRGTFADIVNALSVEAIKRSTHELAREQWRAEHGRKTPDQVAAEHMQKVSAEQVRHAAFNERDHFKQRLAEYEKARTNRS